MKHLMRLLFLLTVLAMATAVQAAGIVANGPMLTADYWLQQNQEGDRVILGPAQIAEWNQKIREASPSMVKLDQFPEKLEGSFIIPKISRFDILQDELYFNGKKASDNYKNILKEQCNLDKVEKSVRVRYGVTVRRSALRTLPTAQGVFYAPEDRDFDVFQETMLDPGEGVIVLHTSKNGYLHFVQAANYCGWISTYNLAFADRDDWLKFVDPKQFLVVTGKNMFVDIGTEKVLYQQGARIAYTDKTEKGYKVLLPVRQKNGKLKVEKKNLVPAKDVSEGYLPYTCNNIIRCALQFCGMPYGWGGLKNSVDCSSLIYNVYRTMGIYLPRNADEQEATYGVHVDFSGLNSAERLNAYTKMRPGAALYTDGNCLLFLGTVEGTPYVIHALATHYQGQGRQRTMRVVVSDLSLMRAGGISYLDAINQALLFGE